jgi:Tfp pilus assembly protein PilE
MLMQRTLGGYTLIEVMIFLAVSSVMLAVTIVAIRGQEAHTEFVTSMNDVSTKMQQWIDQVVNGYSSTSASASSSNFTCTVTPPGNPNTRPALNVVATGNVRGANPDCIFLGKVVQFNDQGNPTINNHIYTYSVIGRRTNIDPSTGNVATSKDLLSARPIAAAGPPVDLTEDYHIPSGTRVIKIVKTLVGDTDSKLGGFFTSFNNQSQSNGSTGLAAVQYPMTINSSKNGAAVTQCIKLNTCITALPNLWPMSKWKILFGSTRNNDRACLIFTSVQGVGVSTKVEYGTEDTLCDTF